MTPTRKAHPETPAKPGTAGPTGDTAVSGPRPIMNRIVSYALSAEDVARIEYRRAQSRARTKYAEKFPAANAVTEGGEYPMVIVRVWEDDSANGKVLLDGEDEHWVTSRRAGDEPGTWFWPARV